MKMFRIEDRNIREVDMKSVGEDENCSCFVVAEPNELDSLKAIFDFNIETVEECRSKNHDTKIEVYPKYNFCTFNEVEIEKDTVKIDELNVYYSSKYIIVVSKAPLKSIALIIKQLQEKDNRLLVNVSNSCNKILYLILDTLFLNYFDSIIEFEKKIEVFEEDVLKNNISKFLGRFIDIRRQVLRLVRFVTPMAYIIDIIKLNENNLIDNEMMRYFENLDIKYNKLDTNMTGLRESVAYLREAYEAEVSNQANNVMKIFTIVSAVFLPLTLLTGIFGMNFKLMPWLERDYGFYELTGLMVVITIVLIALFKRKRWI